MAHPHPPMHEGAKETVVVKLEGVHPTTFSVRNSCPDTPGHTGPAVNYSLSNVATVVGHVYGLVGRTLTSKEHSTILRTLIVPVMSLKWNEELVVEVRDVDHVKKAE